MATSGSSPAGDARRGILWMLLAMAVAVVMDTLNKTLAQIFPVPQLVWARFVFHMVLVTLFLGRRLPRVMVTRRLDLQVVRSFILICATVLFVYGLSLLPLADINAILFVAPVLVTALSAPLLGERVDRRQWIGVALGFAGALVIVRPGSGVMQLAALLPLGAACFFALYQITTKQLTRTDPTMTTLFYSGLLGALAMSVVVPFFWVTAAAPICRTRRWRFCPSRLTRRSSRRLVLGAVSFPAELAFWPDLFLPVPFLFPLDAMSRHAIE